jgi:hypothetical protein
VPEDEPPGERIELHLGSGVTVVVDDDSVPSLDLVTALLHAVDIFVRTAAPELPHTDDASVAHLSPLARRPGGLDVPDALGAGELPLSPGPEEGHVHEHRPR